jgi:hypothetical protein
MGQFTKLAAYLNSFEKGEKSYDLACYIKRKIAQDLNDTATVNNGEEENLEDTDVTMATSKQQTQSNTEGEIMEGAFKELDVMNKLQEEKDDVLHPGRSKDKNINMATTQSFGDNSQNQKQASLYDILIKKLKK